MTAAPGHACRSCGATYRKWQGQCDSCGDWNTISEAGNRPSGGREIPLATLDGEEGNVPRLASRIQEFDRATGGGLVAGSAVLLGGDPGIGKSTLLLQVAGAISSAAECAYVSGEESVDQIRMRARRLGLAAAPVRLAAATSVRDVAATFDKPSPPRLVIADSIQTMYLDSLDSVPGTVSQVRSSADTLIRLAKRRGFSLVLVGHVTKEGAIAGPRMLEHMVDTVLYFEGERGHQFRILRATKNRFGPTDEIGVFEMTGSGLAQVGNPSELFLADRQEGVAGTAVFAGIEGTRPVLVEIQALVGASVPGTPRRAVIGWDSGRLAMVLAVLETRCGLTLSGRDIYLNVAGGMRITEPAADLAVAAALTSAALDRTAAPDTVVFGEIGLSGEVRSVSRTDLRLREAAKLGFDAAWTPCSRHGAERPPGLKVVETRSLRDMMSRFGSAAAEACA